MSRSAGRSAGGQSLITILPSDRWTIIERYALDILLHFRNEGWSCTAATREAMAVDRRIRRFGFPIAHSPLRGPFDIHTIIPLMRIMRRQARKNRVVVHAHRISDALSAVMARSMIPAADIRVVMTHHQPDPIPSGKWSKRLFSRIDAHIAPSKNVVDPALLPCSEIIQYSVNTDASQVPPFPRSGPVCVAYKGELARGNGLETLIDALPLTLPLRPRLIIAGNGKPDYLDRLRRRAQLRGVMERIDWMRDGDDPFAPLAAAHFGIFPSRSRPNAIDRLDFMASGRSFISCADDRDAPFIIAAGELNPQTLADSIRTLAADKALAECLGEQAREHFLSSHAWDDFINHISLIYK